MNDKNIEEFLGYGVAINSSCGKKNMIAALRKLVASTKLAFTFPEP